MTKTISEMKAIQAEKGLHFFSQGAMRFFETKVEATPDRNNRFITSEATAQGDSRRYTVRQFDPVTGDVSNVSDFLQYATLEEARQARRS